MCPANGRTEPEICSRPVNGESGPTSCRMGKWPTGRPPACRRRDLDRFRQRLSAAGVHVRNHFELGSVEGASAVTARPGPAVCESSSLSSCARHSSARREVIRRGPDENASALACWTRRSSPGTTYRQRSDELSAVISIFARVDSCGYASPRAAVSIQVLTTNRVALISERSSVKMLLAFLSRADVSRSHVERVQPGPPQIRVEERRLGNGFVHCGGGAVWNWLRCGFRREGAGYADPRNAHALPADIVAA